MIEVVPVEEISTYWEVRKDGKWVYQTSISLADAEAYAEQLRKEQGDVHSS